MEDRNEDMGYWTFMVPMLLIALLFAKAMVVAWDREFCLAQEAQLGSAPSWCVVQK